MFAASIESAHSSSSLYCVMPRETAPNVLLPWRARTALAGKDDGLTSGSSSGRAQRLWERMYHCACGAQRRC
jgi:hypothetical protein